MHGQTNRSSKGTALLSLDGKFAAAGGRPSGFDYMRLVLACLVIVMHSVSTSYGDVVANRIWGSTNLVLPLRLVLPMFFALSGFLVTGSIERCQTLVSFLGLRVIRIYPALTVEVLLSAFIIGPLLTTVPLSAYFSSLKFFEYVLNITGHIHYLLPGVFANNPKPLIVNGQLWTVPFELGCYLTISALVLLGARKERVIIPIATVLGALLFTGIYLFNARHGAKTDISLGAMLIISFLSGVTFYLYRKEVPWSFPLFVVALVIALAAMAAAPYGIYFTALATGYLTVFLGLTNPARSRVIAGADFSYGIYLYGFVIQQLVMALLPGAREWYWNIAISLPVAAGFAAMSWYGIEKPALRLRPVVFAVEKRFLGGRAKLS